MSTTTATMAGASRRPTDTLAALLRIVEAFKRARTRRRTQLALADLEDHILKDIGVLPTSLHRPHRTMTDWVVQTHSGTARLVFIGR